MLSRIIARFSSALVRRISVTWKSELLPTMVIVLARESSKARRPSSSSALTPLRRVMPKAQTRTCFSGSSQTPLEVLGIFLVRGRVAAFDIVEAQAIEPLGDGQLVLQGEADAFGLRAVAEGRVVDLDAFHLSLSDEGLRVRFRTRESSA